MTKPDERIFTREDIEKANDAVIRATNREPDLRSSFAGQLQIALEAMGLPVEVSPAFPEVEAYKQDRDGTE